MTIGADPGIVFLYITHPSMQLGAIVPADLWNALSKYLISQSCFFFFSFFFIFLDTNSCTTCCIQRLYIFFLAWDKMLCRNEVYELKCSEGIVACVPSLPLLQAPWKHCLVLRAQSKTAQEPLYYRAICYIMDYSMLVQSLLKHAITPKDFKNMNLQGDQRKGH